MGDVVRAPHPALVGAAIVLSPVATALWFLLCAGAWS